MVPRTERPPRWNSTCTPTINITIAVNATRIGENRSDIRAGICAELDQLGIQIDEEKNLAAQGEEAEISAAGSRTKVFVIPTNEELRIAQETKRVIENRRQESEVRKKDI